ncbi:hypothetical protein Ahy_B01g053911 [Arachis hypogaea]|uniref:Protein FAR1-RELATED SEQUENCE n=1 Tax=Arachis hypogaea TaxID=3818 RepID=A0A445ASV8_ARAHY|nr:hypothetical protein Ahy_B01g053911 [Arachis hypogaea]
MAEMRIKKNGHMNKWYVSRFVDDHNYELLPPKLVEYLPPHRKMADVDVAHMDSLRDMYNEVRHQRAMRKGDVNATIRYFEAGAKVDVKLFWRYQKLSECMEGKAPKAVITDGDRSLLLAINDVFPKAHHRFCAWHQDDVVMCVATCEAWQQSVEFLRDNEDEMDFRSLYRMPVLQTQFLELENSGAMNYTQEIFSMNLQSSANVWLGLCLTVTLHSSCISEQVVQEATNPEMMNELGNNVGISGGRENGRVLDPVGACTKGTGCCNVQVGVRRVKRRKCSTCGVKCNWTSSDSVPKSGEYVSDEQPRKGATKVVSQSAARVEFPPAHSLWFENIAVRDYYRQSRWILPIFQQLRMVVPQSNTMA